MNNENWIGALEMFSGFGNQKMAEIGVVMFLFVMTISMLSSLLISHLYTKFYAGRSTGSLIYRAFPLIGLSTTAIFITIQFSLPLSLGLLGALSIVRFRTPIKEPEEIGFIMLVVASSLCCATFNLVFLIILFVISVCGMLMMSGKNGGLIKSRPTGGILSASFPVTEFQDCKQKLIALLAEAVPAGQLDAITEAELEVVVSYQFPSLEPAAVMELQDKIKALSGNSKINFYFTSSLPV